MTALRCDFPGHPGPAGHVPACQLCPNSPTYWRGQPPTEGTKPCQWTPAATAEGAKTGQKVAE